ncbi:MAG: SsrA-binding protein SmpB [Acholeplasmatales bacterium]|jgi:SsrA-binding protein|nr:SsrA-binding protein SmpB [Acholeplasmatales bacterium]
MKVIYITQNKKAYHDYHVFDTYEAGIQLRGSEIKQIRHNKIVINDAYVNIENYQAYLLNADIQSVQNSNIFSHQAKRERKLLLHKNEILKLKMQKERKGFTIIPLKVYINNGLCKVQIALVKGKDKVDKRQALKEKDQKDHLQRILTRSKSL